MRLGLKVRDIVSGFSGIAEARTEWLNGCVRILVQPPVKKDGTLPDAKQFDVEQLEVLGSKSILDRLVPAQSSGGGDAIPRRPAVADGRRR